MRAGNRADILGLGFPPFVFSFKNITLPDKSNKRNIFTFQWIAVVSENSVTFAVEKERNVYAKNHFRTFDAANDGIRADPRGVSAGSRTELPADTAVWVSTGSLRKGDAQICPWYGTPGEADILYDNDNGCGFKTL